MQEKVILVTGGAAALLLEKNRNTINQWHGTFRQAIYRHQTALKEKLIGSVEVDKSYFGAKRRRVIMVNTSAVAARPTACIWCVWAVWQGCIWK